jgi:hypothetical protein
MGQACGKDGRENLLSAGRKTLTITTRPRCTGTSQRFGGSRLDSSGTEKEPVVGSIKHP